jgi:hypothetical protein
MQRAGRILLIVLAGLIASPAVLPARAEPRGSERPTPTPPPEGKKKDRDSDEGSIGRIFRSIGKSDDDKDRKERKDDDRPKEREEKPRERREGDKDEGSRRERRRDD